MSRFLKITILSLTAAFVGFLNVTAVVTAQEEFTGPFDDVCQGEAVNSEVCQAGNNPTNPVSGSEGVLVTILNILSFMVGVASVLMVILGGLKYVTSNGDSNSVSSAKNTVLYALIGLAVFASSQLIIRFVLSKL